MNLQVLGGGIFLGRELTSFNVPSAWRKATRNMMLATMSVERAIAKLPPIKEMGVGNVGFVLGSSSGELETSADFLATWSKSKMARPTLFQNSLHNATTGFASIHFQITGPSSTVSALENTPEECVEMAQGLLRENMCKICIVTLVEAHRVLADWIGEGQVGEGACSAIFSTKEHCRTLGLSAPHEFVGSPESLNYRSPGAHAPLVAIEDSGFFGQTVLWSAAP